VVHLGVQAFWSKRPGSPGSLRCVKMDFLLLLGLQEVTVHMSSTQLFGRLQIGRPPLEAAKPRHIKDSEKAKRVLGESMDFNKIPDACFDSADPSELRYEAMARLLLELFANQLSFFANEILIQQAEREPYRVRMARAYISNHQTEDFSLSDVARSIHISSFHLCKIFKKATGLTFIEFRNRLRIESAMKLLTNPNQSVSEIAYRVGFQSLAQFNRLFRRIIGQSPTTFRCSLKEACSPPSRNGVAVAIKGALPNSASRGNGANRPNCRAAVVRLDFEFSADLPQSFAHAGDAEVDRYSRLRPP
jgi:AraC-like DNA-binding protein